MTQGHRQLTLTKPYLQESARLVASPMLCHNHAGTGTAARAVGVGVLSAARIAARSRVGAMCQLCNVRVGNTGRLSAKRIA